MVASPLSVIRDAYRRVNGRRELYDAYTVYELIVYDREDINSVLNYANSFNTRLSEPVKHYLLEQEKFYRDIKNLKKHVKDEYYSEEDRGSNFRFLPIRNKRYLCFTRIDGNNLKVQPKLYAKAKADWLVGGDYERKMKVFFDFLREVTEKSIKNDMIYEFKMPRDLANYVIRRDGGIFYLDCDREKLDKFVHIVHESAKKHNLLPHLKIKMGVDIPDKKKSWSEFIASKIFEDARREDITTVDFSYVKKKEKEYQEKYREAISRLYTVPILSH